MGFLKNEVTGKKGNFFFKKYVQSENSISKNSFFHGDVIGKPYKNPNRNPSYSHPKHS